MSDLAIPEPTTEEFARTLVSFFRAALARASDGRANGFLRRTGDLRPTVTGGRTKSDGRTASKFGYVARDYVVVPWIAGRTTLTRTRRPGGGAQWFHREDRRRRSRACRRIGINQTAGEPLDLALRQVLRGNNNEQREPKGTEP